MLQEFFKKGDGRDILSRVRHPFDKASIPFVVEEMQGTPEEAVALFCQTVRDSRQGGKNQRADTVKLLQEA